MSTEGPEVGRRNTRQKAAVLQALAGSEQFLSAQHLHERLQRSGQAIGLTTVYRTVQALAAAGLVDAVRTDTEQWYRRCSTGHHHHLVCRQCARTEEIEDSQVEQWAAAAASRHGFTALTHTVEVFGLCPDCANEGDASA